MNKLVVKLGIEIEIACKVTDATYSVLRTLGNWELTSDGSVKCKHNFESHNSGICYECGNKGKRQSEFRTTRTGAYAVNLNDIEGSVNKIAHDVETIYATLEHIDANKSCGIHFHFSGIKKISVIFSREFFDMVKARYMAMATTDDEKARLRNSYCMWEYESNENDTERYRALNIVGAYKKHNTTELRFFPSTDKISKLKIYIRFVLELLHDLKTTKYDVKKFSVPTRTEDYKKEIKILL